MTVEEAVGLAQQLRVEGDAMSFFCKGGMLSAYGEKRFFVTSQFETAGDVEVFVEDVRDAIDEYYYLGFWPPQLGEERNGKRVVSLDREKQLYYLDGETEGRPWRG